MLCEEKTNLHIPFKGYAHSEIILFCPLKMILYKSNQKEGK